MTNKPVIKKPEILSDEEMRTINDSYDFADNKGDAFRDAITALQSQLEKEE